MQDDRLDQELGDQEKLLLVFGYLGPLALVTLVTSRRELVKWHAKQGLVLTATLLVAWPVMSLVHRFLNFVWVVFGELFRVGTWLAVIGVALAMLVSIIRGLEGERFKVPVVGELADRL